MELRAFRQALGLSLDAVSAELGVSKGTLSKVERKISAPGGALLMKINDWAEEQRRRKRMPASSRLDWSYLNDPSEAASA